MAQVELRCRDGQESWKDGWRIGCSVCAFEKGFKFVRSEPLSTSTKQQNSRCNVTPWPTPFAPGTVSPMESETSSRRAAVRASQFPHLSETQFFSRMQTSGGCCNLDCYPDTCSSSSGSGQRSAQEKFKK
uniref:(northern house mosquito) hypothetical protein n=1 Tax=Culex pipiens TaxID=7175 RepID=A0A8D8FD63_CULPI